MREKTIKTQKSKPSSILFSFLAHGHSVCIFTHCCAALFTAPAQSLATSLAATNAPEFSTRSASRSAPTANSPRSTRPHTTRGTAHRVSKQGGSILSTGYEYDLHLIGACERSLVSLLICFFGCRQRSPLRRITKIPTEKPLVCKCCSCLYSWFIYIIGFC